MVGTADSSKLLNKGGLHQGRSGKVHGNRKRLPALINPSLQLCTDKPEHIKVNETDGLRLLQERKEISRKYQRIRVGTVADKGLGAYRRTVRGGNLRLQINHEMVLVNFLLEHGRVCQVQDFITVMAVPVGKRMCAVKFLFIFIHFSIRIGNDLA